MPRFFEQAFFQSELFRFLSPCLDFLKCLDGSTKQIQKVVDTKVACVILREILRIFAIKIVSAVKVSYLALIIYKMIFWKFEMFPN